MRNKKRKLSLPSSSCCIIPHELQRRNHLSPRMKGKKHQKKNSSDKMSNICFRSPFDACFSLKLWIRHSIINRTSTKFDGGKMFWASHGHRLHIVMRKITTSIVMYFANKFCHCHHEKIKRRIPRNCTNLIGYDVDLRISFTMRCLFCFFYGNAANRNIVSSRSVHFFCSPYVTLFTLSRL